MLAHALTSVFPRVPYVYYSRLLSTPLAEIKNLCDGEGFLHTLTDFIISEHMSYLPKEPRSKPSKINRQVTYLLNLEVIIIPSSIPKETNVTFRENEGSEDIGSLEERRVSSRF